MKKLIFLLIVTLISFCTCSAQEVKVETVQIPVEVLNKVIDELLVKDHLQFTVNVQDSILAVYKQKDSVHREKINTYILKEQEYKSIVSSLEQRMNIKDAQITYLKKEGKKGKLKSFLTGTAVGGIIAAILILL